MKDRLKIGSRVSCLIEQAEPNYLVLFLRTAGHNYRGVLINETCSTVKRAIPDGFYPTKATLDEETTENFCNEIANRCLDTSSKSTRSKKLKQSCIILDDYDLTKGITSSKTLNTTDGNNQIGKSPIDSIRGLVESIDKNNDLALPSNVVSPSKSKQRFEPITSKPSLSKKTDFERKIKSMRHDYGLQKKVAGFSFLGSSSRVLKSPVKVLNRASSFHATFSPVETENYAEINKEETDTDLEAVTKCIPQLPYNDSLDTTSKLSSTSKNTLRRSPKSVANRIPKISSRNPKSVSADSTKVSSIAGTQEAIVKKKIRYKIVSSLSRVKDDTNLASSIVKSGGRKRKYSKNENLDNKEVEENTNKLSPALKVRIPTKHLQKDGKQEISDTEIPTTETTISVTEIPATETTISVSEIPAAESTMKRRKRKRGNRNKFSRKKCSRKIVTNLDNNATSVKSLTNEAEAGVIQRVVKERIVKPKRIDPIVLALRNIKKYDKLRKNRNLRNSMLIAKIEKSNSLRQKRNTHRNAKKKSEILSRDIEVKKIENVESTLLENNAIFAHKNERQFGIGHGRKSIKSASTSSLLIPDDSACSADEERPLTTSIKSGSTSSLLKPHDSACSADEERPLSRYMQRKMRLKVQKKNEESRKESIRPLSRYLSKRLKHDPIDCKELIKNKPSLNWCKLKKSQIESEKAHVNEVLIEEMQLERKSVLKSEEIEEKFNEQEDTPKSLSRCMLKKSLGSVLVIANEKEESNDDEKPLSLCKAKKTSTENNENSKPKLRLNTIQNKLRETCSPTITTASQCDGKMQLRQSSPLKINNIDSSTTKTVKTDECDFAGVKMTMHHKEAQVTIVKKGKSIASGVSRNIEDSPKKVPLLSNAESAINLQPELKVNSINLNSSCVTSHKEFDVQPNVQPVTDIDLLCHERGLPDEKINEPVMINKPRKNRRKPIQVFKSLPNPAEEEKRRQEEAEEQERNVALHVEGGNGGDDTCETKDKKSTIELKAHNTRYRGTKSVLPGLNMSPRKSRKPRSEKLILSKRDKSLMIDTFTALHHQRNLFSRDGTETPESSLPSSPSTPQSFTEESNSVISDKQESSSLSINDEDYFFGATNNQPSTSERPGKKTRKKKSSLLESFKTLKPLTRGNNDIRTDDIVWGKCMGFGWWPGHVMSILKHNEETAAEERQANVSWMGSNTRSVMKLKDLDLFLPHFKKRFVSTKKGMYFKAVSQAQSICKLKYGVME